MIKGRKYLTILKLSLIHNIKNYKILIGLSIFLIACLLIFANLWEIMATKVGAVALDADKLLWYIAFNEWILLAIPKSQEEIENDLRTGKLAYILPRPISYLTALFFESLGELLSNLFFLGFTAFTFTWIVTGDFPFSPHVFLISIVLGVLAGCLGILFQMVIGITAFWIHEVEPFNWIWEKFLFALGGLILPLTVYPKWLQTVASCTPFPAILGGRSFLAIHFSMQNALMILTQLLFWGLFAFMLLAILFKRGEKIINIEGG